MFTLSRFVKSHAKLETIVVQIGAMLTSAPIPKSSSFTAFGDFRAIFNRYLCMNAHRCVKSQFSCSCAILNPHSLWTRAYCGLINSFFTVKTQPGITRGLQLLLCPSTWVCPIILSSWKGYVVTPAQSVPAILLYPAEDVDWEPSAWTGGRFYQSVHAGPVRKYILLYTH